MFCIGFFLFGRIARRRVPHSRRASAAKCLPALNLLGVETQSGCTSPGQRSHRAPVQGNDHPSLSYSVASATDLDTSSIPGGEIMVFLVH